MSVSDSFADWVSPHLRALRRWDRFDVDRGTPRTWLRALTADQVRRHRRRWARSPAAIGDAGIQPEPLDQIAQPDIPASASHNIRTLTTRGALPAVASAVAAVLAISIGGVLWHERSGAASSGRENGDSTVTAEAVRTTFDLAAALTSPNASTPPRPDTPVWLVQIHGQSTCTSVCFGQLPPVTGTTMYVILDTRTYDARAFGVSNHPVDLASLGPVVPLIG